MTHYQTKAMPDFSDLIGIPYKTNGRSKEEGFDCYGLAIEVEKRLGKTLQDVVYSNRDFILAEENAPLLNITKTQEILMGSLLEFRIGNTLHIGVALSPSTFIHATENQGVRISRICAFNLTNIYEVL